MINSSSKPPPSISNVPSPAIRTGTLVPIAELKPWAKNARTHSPKQISQIAASIAEFGFLGHILADSHGNVIAGHGRLEAARQLGMTHVPALQIDHLTPEQVRAYRIADNRLAELAGWDDELLRLEFSELDALELNFDLAITGFETVEIDTILQSPTSVHEDDPADALDGLADAPVSRSGDLWLLDKHRLLCGSALEPDQIERLMDGASADMAFTDPPYNVPVGGHVCGLGKIQHREFAMASGEMTEAQFTEFLTTSLGAISGSAKDGAVQFVCMDWRHLWEILTAAKAVGLHLINFVVWNKTNGGMGSLYRSKHELILVLKKGRGPHVNNVQLGKFGRYRANVWDYAGVNSFGANRMEELESHPTVKPTAMVADAIRDVSNRGEIVLDPFMGSGTTLLAAERTGRTAYGLEIDPLYVDLAVRRWEKLTGRSAVLQPSGQTFAEVSETPSSGKTAEGGATGSPRDLAA